jgi:undecaprenyl-diphosphatase
MLLGLRREDAARFSFLLSVPIILGAGAYKLWKALPALRGEAAWRDATLAATLVSLAAGYLVIGWLLRWLRTRTTHLFVAWRLVAAAAVALLVWQGALPAGGAAPPPAPVLRAP